MTTHIRLELRPEGDSFTGRATSDETSLDFHGWLGLLGAIEALCPIPDSPNTDKE